MRQFLIMLLLITSFAKAQESCDSTLIKQDVNTPVPEQLKDKEICIRDNKTGDLDCNKSTNDYKIVKRKQQFKVTEKIVKEPNEPIKVYETPKQNKNLIMLGLRKDVIGLSKDFKNKEVVVSQNRDLVLDFTYFRRKLFDSNFGLGIGIDTNTTLKGSAGLEY